MVSIKNGDCTGKPVVEHNYLGEELDAEVLGVACEWGNTIVMEGEGTRGVAVGGWPRGSGHHLLEGTEEWKGFVREHATTGGFFFFVFLVSCKSEWVKISFPWAWRV